MKHKVSDDPITKFIESLDFYFENPSLVNEDLLEFKIKELILLFVQTKNVESVLELVSDLYSTRMVNNLYLQRRKKYQSIWVKE